MGLNRDQSSGRLEPDGDWLRTADAKIPVAEASPHSDRAHRHNDIRRLAACWNACDGISTHVLEQRALGAMGGTFPWQGPECDSPELCAVGKGCAGQFETRKICTQHAPAKPNEQLLPAQGEAYKPLDPDEIHALTCMQAGAPWESRLLQALAECIGIYEQLRSQGKRPVDPALSGSNSGAIKPALTVSVPSMFMNWVRFKDGSYGVDLMLHGLATEQQAAAAMAHMQHLLCSHEIKPGEMS